MGKAHPDHIDAKSSRGRTELGSAEAKGGCEADRREICVLDRGQVSRLSNKQLPDKPSRRHKPLLGDAKVAGSATCCYLRAHKPSRRQKTIPHPTNPASANQERTSTTFCPHVNGEAAVHPISLITLFAPLSMFALGGNVKCMISTPNGETLRIAGENKRPIAPRSRRVRCRLEALRLTADGE